MCVRFIAGIFHFYAGMSDYEAVKNFTAPYEDSSLTAVIITATCSTTLLLILITCLIVVVYRLHFERMRMEKPESLTTGRSSCTSSEIPKENHSPSSIRKSCSYPAHLSAFELKNPRPVSFNVLPYIVHPANKKYPGTFQPTFPYGRTVLWKEYVPREQSNSTEIQSEEEDIHAHTSAKHTHLAWYPSTPFSPPCVQVPATARSNQDGSAPERKTLVCPPLTYEAYMAQVSRIKRIPGRGPDIRPSKSYYEIIV